MSHGRSRRGLARTGATLLMSLALMLGAAPAWASGFDTGGNLPGTGGTGSTPGNSGGDPDTGDGGVGNPGTGTGGGTGGVGSGGDTDESIIYWNNNRTIWRTSSPPVPANIGVGGEFNPAGASAAYRNQCVAPTKWGPNLGTRVIDQGYKKSGNIGMDGSGDALKMQTSAGYNCVEPPRYVDVDLLCPVSASAKVWGTEPHSWGVLRTLPKQTTKWAKSGRTNTNACQGNWPVYFNGGTWTALGKYKLTATGYVERCNWRRYTTPNAQTGVKPADEITCGPAEPINFKPALMQIFCAAPGLAYDWADRGYSYTMADCQGPPGADKWTCGPQVGYQPNVFGAKGGDAEVLDDGKPRRASWATPVPAGAVRRITERQMFLDFRGGTPSRVGKGPKDQTQPFVVEPMIESWVTGWRGTAPKNRSGWDVQFFAPGYNEDPWTARPKWTFSAEFLRTQVRIIGVDLRTGQILTETTKVWVRDDATCIGQPMTAHVFRARNSSH